MKKQVINVPKKVNVIGVPISAINMEDSLNFICENFDAIRGEYICASNAHTTVIAHDDKEYLKVQSESVMSLPDGKPLSVIGKKKGFKNMEKVTGFHFMTNIFTNERFKNRKHYFYGTTKENLDLMINEVKKDYSNLKICGCEPSLFRELSDDELLELASRINNSKADFIWIAIGAPRQEKLMFRLKGKVNGIMVGVGGAFNILAKKVNDAPKWMQKIGLEWLYRLIKEPRRLFKRYLVNNSKFLWYSWREK